LTIEDLAATLRTALNFERTWPDHPGAWKDTDDALAKLLALVERLQRENEELREVTRGRYGDVVERLQRELDRHTRAARGDGLPYAR
jgi:hypothetical protein